MPWLIKIDGEVKIRGLKSIEEIRDLVLSRNRDLDKSQLKIYMIDDEKFEEPIRRTNDIEFTDDELILLSKIIDKLEIETLPETDLLNFTKLHQKITKCFLDLMIQKKDERNEQDENRHKP